MKHSLVLGYRGLVGSALMRRLPNALIGGPIRNRDDAVDMETEATETVDEIYMAAGRVGGVMLNAREPWMMFADNVEMGLAVIQAAIRERAALCYLGSSCVYRPSLRPIPESALGQEPDDGNAGYAWSKLACIKACEFARRQHGLKYVMVMPCNLYGPNDRYSDQDGHVIPTLMKRIHDAKVSGAPSVTIWGNGSALREFLYVDDLADACVRLMEAGPRGEVVNIGYGEDISIAALVKMLVILIGYRGEIVWDQDKPNGVHRKLLNCEKAKDLIGWKPAITLEAGLVKTYRWMVEHEKELRT